MTQGIDAALSDSWTISSLLRNTNHSEGSVFSEGGTIPDIKGIYKSSPVFGTLEETLKSPVFEYPEILDRGIIIDGFKGFQLVTGFELLTFPAPIDVHVLTTDSNFTDGIASSLSTDTLAPQSIHCFQYLIALLVVFKFSEFLQDCGQSPCDSTEIVLDQFLL
jgi:hypothetical protein